MAIKHPAADILLSSAQNGQGFQNREEILADKTQTSQCFQKDEIVCDRLVSVDQFKIHACKICQTGFEEAKEWLQIVYFFITVLDYLCQFS